MRVAPGVARGCWVSWRRASGRAWWAAAFSFTLDNAHLVKLARTPVSVHKILVVMIVPRSQDDWLRAGPGGLDLRHCCYWTNLAGHAVTGPNRTTVRIPTTRIFDDRAL